MERYLRWLREVLRGPDADRALAAERAIMRSAIASARDDELEREQRRIAKRADTIAIGERTEDAGGPFLAALPELLAHMLVIGASGAGKSYLLLLLAMAAYAAGLPLVVIDPKAEFAELLLDRLLPAFLARLPPSEAQRALASIRVVDPFGRDALPPMNPLVRDPSIPIEVQALDVASCFDATVDAGSGVRMETILDWVLRLVIEVGGSFITVRRALEEPPVLEGLVRQSRVRDVVSYFLNRWPNEPASSKLALLARIDRLLALPSSRLSLGADACVDFDAALSGGITVVNVGNAPAGLTELSAFWSTFVFTRLVRAVYRRPATGAGTRHAITLIDEWQTCLTRPFASSMEDVLARSRSRRCAFWLCNQQKAQVEKVSGSLWDIVAAQTAIHVLFRASIEDARAMRHVLPVSGRMRRPSPPPWAHAPAASPYLTASEEIEARVSRVAQLPRQHAYWWDRRKSHAAVPLRTATLDLPDPRRVPAALRAAVARGAVARPASDLARALDAEMRRLDQLARYGAGAPAAPGAGGTTAPPKARKKHKGPGGLPW